MVDSVKVGMKARFFHPRTLGVMHQGTVIKADPSAPEHRQVLVRFDVDDKAHWTFPDCIVRKQEGSDGL